MAEITEGLSKSGHTIGWAACLLLQRWNHVDDAHCGLDQLRISASGG